MNYHCCLFFKELKLGYEVIINDKLKQQIFREVPELESVSIFGESVPGEISFVNILRKFLKPATKEWVVYLPKFQEKPEIGLTVHQKNIYIFNKSSKYITVDCKKITVRFIKINT